MKKVGQLFGTAIFIFIMLSGISYAEYFQIPPIPSDNPPPTNSAPPEPAPPEQPAGDFDSPTVPTDVITLAPPEELPPPADSMSTLNVSVSASSNTGAASAAIPIQVPPGRKGLAPNLALTYNSSGGNGMIGVGWSLELGAIQRATKRGVNYNPNESVHSVLTTSL